MNDIEIAELLGVLNRNAQRIAELLGVLNRNAQRINELERLLEQAQGIAAALEAELHDLRGTE